MRQRCCFGVELRWVGYDLTGFKFWACIGHKYVPSLTPEKTWPSLLGGRDGKSMVVKLGWILVQLGVLESLWGGEEFPELVIRNSSVAEVSLGEINDVWDMVVILVDESSCWLLLIVVCVKLSVVLNDPVVNIMILGNCELMVWVEMVEPQKILAIVFQLNNNMDN